MNQYANYHVFSSFIFRTPVFSLRQFHVKPNSLNSDNIFKNKKFIEALFIASPALHREMGEYNKEKLNKEKLLKFKISILKYYTRMCTRCTPFGHFAGCGFGEIEEESSVIIAPVDEFQSSTRLDMNYLCALVMDTSNLEEVKLQTRYFPNTSLYNSGKNLRYTEYYYFKAQRKYVLSQAEQSNYLQKILEKAENGKTINELAELLLNDEITFDEAKGFIDILIDNQLLVSELEPAVTGNELLQQFIDKLKRFQGISTIISNLKNVEVLLQNIDKLPIGRPVSLYEVVKRQLGHFKTKYDKKYLFQSDLFIKSEKRTISKAIVDAASKAVSIFNRLTPTYENHLLKKFCEDFYKKYEEEEVPLVQALDVETGIGFGNIDGQSRDVTPLLEGLRFLGSLPLNKDIKIDPIQAMLIKKYEAFLKDSSNNEIEITEKDIAGFNEKWDDLPITLFAMIEVIRTEEETGMPIIVMRHAGGSSAANPFSRFCYLDGEIYSFVKEITKKEQELNPNKILAEIVHLPESRLGNVLMRPALREYEIPYLANTSVENNKVILITDLMVSVPHGKYIKLRSKKLDKEIIPRLTSAHNFSNNSLPLYHFLCTMQTQGVRGSIGFNWGAFLKSKSFLPRVRFDNIILSPATWNITSEDTKKIPKITDKYFFEEVAEFKNKKKLPNLVLLVQGDNKLLIDFNNPLSIQMLFSDVKKRGFYLEEFLFDGDYPLVKRGNEVFTNQVVICFYKNNKKR